MSQLARIKPIIKICIAIDNKKVSIKNIEQYEN
jgi:hypothetical protein